MQRVMYAESEITYAESEITYAEDDQLLMEVNEDAQASSDHEDDEWVLTESQCVAQLAGRVVPTAHCGWSGNKSMISSSRRRRMHRLAHHACKSAEG